MLKKIDYMFGVLLILASCGHIAGTILWLQPMSGIFIWSLGSALAGLLLGVLNIVRAGRPFDKTLAVVTAAGTIGWIGVALAFGVSIGNVFDPRPLIHVFVSLVLVAFGFRSITRSGKHAETGDCGASAVGMEKIDKISEKTH